MKRTYHSFPVKNINIAKQQMLNWASQFSICCFMDNHAYDSAHNSIECLLGVGAIATFEKGADFSKTLDRFHNNARDWIFGHFNYDLKNQFDPNLSSSHPDFIGFPDVFLFIPEVVVQLQGDDIIIGVITDDPHQILNDIFQASVSQMDQTSSFQLKSRITRNDYIKTIEHLLGHIKRGDCYEINFCQEFYAENASINPLQVYKQLTQISPNPFSTFYKLDNKYLLCASPERYLKKTGNTLLSQPIKGTWKRSPDNPQDDLKNRRSLLESEKDRSENVMVVDLVRNDLSRICEKGSVQVEELFGIYTFPQVYQMISSVTGKLKQGTSFSEILTSTFPMGSMTGAPKKRVMELIEQYEHAKRGIFSGAVGYISPQKNFDFNVVIRSILYNQQTGYLSYLVGGGITNNSIPQHEYDECLLKATAIKKVLLAQ